MVGLRNSIENRDSNITFPNLGKDTLLVVPCPITNIPQSTHLADLIREAPTSQQHLLWKTVGRSLEQNLGQQPI